MEEKVTERKESKIFYGWWIVAVGNIMRTVSATFNYYGFSAFFNPLVDQFGWSRAALAGVLSLSRLEGGAMAIPAGFMFDRTGTYQDIFMIYGGVVMLSALCIALIRRPYWAEIVAREHAHMETSTERGQTSNTH